MTKPFSPREIVARVHASLRRSGAVPGPPPAPLAIGDLEIDRWAKQVRIGGHAIALTAATDH